MKTEVGLLNGRPVIFVDGNPHHSIFCSVQEKYMQNFIDAGFEIFDTHPSISVGWADDNTYDYSLTDRQIETYLAQKKNALLILRFWMGYPNEYRCGKQPGASKYNTWWVNKYPDHECRPYTPDNRPQFASFSSPKWRREAGQALRRVIKHTEEKYGDNVLAYVPGGGPCGEWMQWHCYAIESNINPADYSEFAEKGFRDYLKGVYGNAISALNRRWNTGYASFDAVKLPEPAMRAKAWYNDLRDPSKECAVLDFYEYYNSIVADTLIEWSRIAKDACERRKLILAFYGYQWVSNERHALCRTGHIHLDRVLKSPDIDVIVAPYMYDFREVGGVVSSQTLNEAIRNAGKILLVEMDPATSIKADWAYKNHLPTSHEESIELMKRDLVYTLTNGAANWYMDLMGGMYDHPELVKGLDAVRKIGEEHSLSAGEGCAEIAVVLHGRASFYFREADPFLGPLFSLFKLWEIERMGAPFDDFLLEELENIDTDRYKLFIIPDAVFLSEKERELIKRKCCCGNKTVVWCYAAGVLSDEGLSIDGMCELTGIKTGYTMEPGELNVEIIDDGHLLTAGMKMHCTYGTNGSYLPIGQIKEQTCLNIYPDAKTGFGISPRFWADDAEAEVLGVLEGTGRPGLAVKKLHGWKSVFSSAPMIPKEILRNIALDAGCHVYTGFLGQIMACKGYVGFYAHDSGECRVKLPYKAKVHEVFSGKLLSEASDEVVLNVEKNTTFLLRYVPL